MRQLALFLEQPDAVSLPQARSLDDLDEDTLRRFYRKVAPWPDADGHRWWLGAISGGRGGGHGKFQLRRGDRTQTVLAHRLAWHLEHGPLDPALILRHTCDVRLCTSPAHLVPGTAADNVRDMLDRGRHRSGSRRWHASRDPRPPALLSHDVRSAVRRALGVGGADPSTVAEAARDALAAVPASGHASLPLLGLVAGRTDVGICARPSATAS